MPICLSKLIKPDGEDLIRKGESNFLDSGRYLCQTPKHVPFFEVRKATPRGGGQDNAISAAPK